MKILITGANGFIGNFLFNKLYKEHDVTPITREIVDLTNQKKLNYFFEKNYFDVVLHCSINGGIRTVKDSWDISEDNIIMYYNLLYNKNNFKKFINFGSGAELYHKDTPYGYSKSVISKSLKNYENFYNLRIYATFDENELESRFIKSNLLRYINKQNILIHENKKMDFFYTEDLFLLVKHYLQNDNLPKEIDCTYKETKSLFDIAEIINNLSDYSVPISIENKKIENNYFGNYTDISIKYFGLEYGIKNVYNNLICKK